MRPPTLGGYIVNGVVSLCLMLALALIVVGFVVSASEQIQYWRAQ